MPTMFEAFIPALQQAGIPVQKNWRDTKTVTLAQAKAQLARTDIKPETAAKWNKRVYIVAADLGKNPRVDPRVTAKH